MAEIKINPGADVQDIGGEERLLVQSIGGGSTGIGTVVNSPTDTVVGVGATVALPTAPVGTRRMVVQVTSGDATTTVVRIREVGGAAGTGIILVRYGSRVYGGQEGALADLEAEHIAGPATTVAVQFEID